MERIYIHIWKSHFLPTPWKKKCWQNASILTFEDYDEHIIFISTRP